jgi:hypothetical protein
MIIQISKRIKIKMESKYRIKQNSTTIIKKRMGTCNNCMILKYENGRIGDKCAYKRQMREFVLLN